MFFIIQIALPRDRVFCGYTNRFDGSYGVVFNNTTSHRACMYETQDEAQETIDSDKNLQGCLVCELKLCE